MQHAVAGKAGLSKTDAGKAVDATIDAITEALKAGEKLTLIGFGTFSVSNLGMFGFRSSV